MGNKSFDLGFMFDVGEEGRAILTEFLRERREAIAIDVTYGDVCASRDESPGNFPPDTGGAAGNDDDFALVFSCSALVGHIQVSFGLSLWPMLRTPL